MRPRSHATPGVPSETAPWSDDGMDVTFDLLSDAPRTEPEPTGSLTVCLACGAAPSPDPDCAHAEIVHLQVAPAELRAAVVRLRDLSLSRRAQERVLRKLVSMAVSAGHGEVQVASRPAALATPPLPRMTQGSEAPSENSPCPQCGQRTSPRPRRRGAVEGQGYFSFATPSRAVPATMVVPAQDLPGATVEPVPPAASARARRRRKAPPADGTPEPVSLPLPGDLPVE